MCIDRTAGMQTRRRGCRAAAERPEGLPIYSLSGADTPYRLMVDHMQEGAVTLSDNGIILYGKKEIARLLGLAPSLVGPAVPRFWPPKIVPLFAARGLTRQQRDLPGRSPPGAARRRRCAGRPGPPTSPRRGQVKPRWSSPINRAEAVSGHHGLGGLCHVGPRPSPGCHRGLRSVGAGDSCQPGRRPTVPRQLAPAALSRRVPASSRYRAKPRRSCQRAR